jgi:hypothetical protein
MTPFDSYKMYVSLKNHFSRESYDYHKYCGKSRASLQSFYKRKDRFWFEKISRQKSEKEILNFFVSNFISADNPQNLWIGDWMRRQQSLTYLFKEQSNELFSQIKLEDALNCSKGHPPVLKKFLSGKLSLETFVIYDKIFSFSKDFDKKLLDPVWETVSLKIKKYKPFLNIDIFQYKQILRDIINV